MTDRELEIVGLFGEFRDVEKVAELLEVSPKRVRNVLALARHAMDVDTPVCYEEDTSPEVDTSCILVVPDLHIPYQHQEALAFLKWLQDTYAPTCVVCTGDEVDHHCLSFHTSNPDLSGPRHELELARAYISELHDMFPEMHVLHSNHGSMVYRKAMDAGVSAHYLKGYRETLEVGDGWNWYTELFLTLPNGQEVYFHHGKTSNVLRLSQSMGCNAVQGHYHESAGVQWWSNPKQAMWGLQMGCLVDRKSLAFAYNNTNLKRPILGAAVITEGVPQWIPLNG